MRFLGAAIQLNSTSDEAENLDSAKALVRQAVAYGATFVATPEHTNYLGPHEEKARRAQSLDGPVCARFSKLARQLGAHVLLGSFNEKSDDPGRCFNTSVLFGPTGDRLAVYRKIHLFDVDISADVRFSESETVQPGQQVVVASTDLAAIGMSVCFDLRFSWLYAELAAGGAQLITVPSAFTLTTGKDHWHALLRARAIETQCWLMAPAQVGGRAPGSPCKTKVYKSMEIKELQRLIDTMYSDRDRRRGSSGTFLWLVEEIGELAAAIGEGTHEEKEGEFADVLAWVVTLANVEGVDLDKAMEKYAR